MDETIAAANRPLTTPASAAVPLLAMADALSSCAQPARLYDVLCTSCVTSPGGQFLHGEAGGALYCGALATKAVAVPRLIPHRPATSRTSIADAPVSIAIRRQARHLWAAPTSFCM